MTRENPADMLTKGLLCELLDEHVAFVNGYIPGKRDRSAFKLNAVRSSDAWAKGRYTNGAITRIHFKLRETLFMPMRMAGGPKDARAVGTTRLTVGQFEDGERVVVRDNWKASKEPCEFD